MKNRLIAVLMSLALILPAFVLPVSADGENLAEGTTLYYQKDGEGQSNTTPVDYDETEGAYKLHVKSDAGQGVMFKAFSIEAGEKYVFEAKVKLIDSTKTNVLTSTFTGSSGFVCDTSVYTAKEFPITSRTDYETISFKFAVAENSTVTWPHIGLYASMRSAFYIKDISIKKVVQALPESMPNLAEGKTLEYSDTRGNQAAHGAVPYDATEGAYKLEVLTDAPQGARFRAFVIEKGKTYIFEAKVKLISSTKTNVLNSHFEGSSGFVSNTSVYAAKEFPITSTTGYQTVSFKFAVADNSSVTWPHVGLRANLRSAFYIKDIVIKEATADMTVTTTGIENGATISAADGATITYTFSNVPYEMKAANVSVTPAATVNVTQVSDKQYTVNLSGLKDGTKYTVSLVNVQDMNALEAVSSISFRTKDTSVPEGITGYLWQTFDNLEIGSSPNFFTGDLSNAKIEYKPGSTTDKVLAFSNGSDGMKKLNFEFTDVIDAADGVVELSFDFCRKNNHDQIMLVYLGGYGGTQYSGSLYTNKLIDYPASSLLVPINNGSGWHNISIRIDAKKKIFTAALDGRSVCDEFGMAKEGTFREANFKDLSWGFFGFNASNAQATMLIDNVKAVALDENCDRVVSLDFEKQTGFNSGALSSVVAKINDNEASNGEESGNAAQFNYGTSVLSNTSILPSAISSGFADVSFDIYRSSQAPDVEFELISTDKRTLLNSSITNSGQIKAAHLSDVVSTIPTDKWVNVKYRVNLNNKTFTVFVDGVQSSSAYPIEDVDANDLIKVDVLSSGGLASSKKVQIDNFVVSTEVTKYDLSISSNDCVVDNTNYVLRDCPINATINSFLSSITASRPTGSVAVYSADGKLKNGSDILEKYDIVVVEDNTIARTVKYTVIPDYSVDFTGVTVNGNEYYEASKILESGTATVRARLINNTDTDGVFTLYAASVDDKLYDVKLEKNIEVKAGGTFDLKLNLKVPDNSDTTMLKLIMVDATDGMTPVCNAEKKLAYTSQITRMPEIFSDNMVLQRGEEVNIFGFAPTGSEIEVTFGDVKATGVASNGCFNVKLPSMAATNVGKVLTVKAGSETFTYNNVVVGEVLYGSGQSNMQRTIRESAGAQKLGLLNDVRCFNVSNVHTTADRVDGNVSENWDVVTSGNVNSQSAILYATAHYLREFGAIGEDVPIGLINCSWGGTSIAMWMSANALENAPVDSNRNYYQNYLNGAVDSKGIRNTDLYSSMARSVVPYTVKAVIWYQGENDADCLIYDKYLNSLVAEMRADFGKEVPYYCVQLPGYALNSWKEFRLVQFKSHDPENDIHVVVTNDTGEVGDIHPQDKDVVGDRIARHIAYNTYGINTVPYQGPVFKSASASGSNVTISFDFVNDGLHGGLCSLADNNSLTGFEVSADGKAWHSASAAISGDTIVVSSANVSSPAYVRYGYVAEPIKSAGTNTNGAKLPLAPFSKEIN